MPNTYHSTTSVLSIERSCAVHRARPLSASLRLGNSPHGQRSSGRYGVTHRVCPITAARRRTGEDGSRSAGNEPPGTSLYPTGVPSPFLTLSLTIFQLFWVCQS